MEIIQRGFISEYAHHGEIHAAVAFQRLHSTAVFIRINDLLSAYRHSNTTRNGTIVILSEPQGEHTFYIALRGKHHLAVPKDSNVSLALALAPIQTLIQFIQDCFRARGGRKKETSGNGLSGVRVLLTLAIRYSNFEEGCKVAKAHEDPLPYLLSPEDTRRLLNETGDNGDRQLFAWTTAPSVEMNERRLLRCYGRVGRVGK
ncbi:hypothetical protein OPQ81_001345 [Rhizoctonia solani]|nr:hypothetical protein OPQ81_001345 [Rhizoctonia solani]